MKIVVCVKYVPDVQSDRHFDNNRIVRELDDTLNEVDENAVETAVSIAEKNNDVEVIALTMGPEDASDAVRRALQMGADKGIHICDDILQGSNVLDTSKVLSAAIKKIGDVSIVITGMVSSDGSTSMLPGYLSTILGIPLLSFVTDVKEIGTQVKVLRNIDSLEQELLSDLPVVMSVTDQINEPRYPNFKAMAAARKKPIDTWDLSELGLGDFTHNTNIEIVSIDKNLGKEKGEILISSSDSIKKIADFIREKVK